MHYQLFKIFPALLLVSLTFGCAKKFKMERESLAAENSWTYHHADLQSTGRREGSFSGKLNIIWEESFATRPSSPMALAKGFLILPDSKKKIRFYDSNTGEFRGFVRTKGYTATGMVVKDSLAYYIDGPRRYNLRCVNLLRRKALWIIPVKDATSGSIIVGNNLIVSLTEGTILSFDLITGEKQWSREIKSRLLAAPSAFDNTIIQPADDGSLYFISAENGEEIRAMSFESPFLSPAVVGDFVFTVGMDGAVTATEKNSNAEIWSSSVAGPVWSAPAVDNDRVYVTGNAGEIVALDAATGAVSWKFDAKNVITSAPIVVGEFVVFGTKSGQLYSLNSGTGQISAERQLSGAISQNPVSDGRFVYVASDHGELVCLGDSNEIASLRK